MKLVKLWFNARLLVLSSVKNGSPCVFIEVGLKNFITQISFCFEITLFLKGSDKCADLFSFALSKLTVRDELTKTESLRP